MITMHLFLQIDLISFSHSSHNIFYLFFFMNIARKNLKLSQNCLNYKQKIFANVQ